jgi:hypothetical protein
MKTKMLRQGDVLLVRVKNIPKTAVKQTPINGRIVLALGEVTGHSHTIDSDAADWWKDKMTEYVTVKTSTPAVHQEHGPLPLEKWENYRKVQQREYSPEAIRPVLD